MKTFNGPPGIEQEFCDWIDWGHSDLGESRMFGAYQAGDCATAAVGVIHYLRNRETPRLGFTKGYVEQLRTKSGPERRRAASQSWVKALEQDMMMPYHSNAFAALGAETIHLGATPDLCRRMSARVLEYRDTWSEGYWGVTHSICQVLRFLWPLVECEDENLVPLFVWLLKKSEREWNDARNWNEIMLGTSGHNWWAHTLHGFWMLGAFFPELKGAERFSALAPGYLERELNVLFETDGWSKEGSPGYHEFAASSLMQFASLAEQNGVVLSESLRQRLRTIADAGWRLLAPDGDYPLFGDFVRAGLYAGFHGQGRTDQRPCSVLRRRAALFSLPYAKYVAESIDAGWESPYGDFIPHEGRDLMSAYRNLPCLPPPLPDTCLPQSGYYVIRQNWTVSSDYAAIVAGPLGQKITSHKHADIFHFELYSRGRRILVDNGYGPVVEERQDPQTRMWRVGSTAHNVGTVDGENHVPVVREFLFGANVSPTVDDWRSDAGYAYFSGVHEGYLRLPNKLTAIRRKLFYLRGKYWILIDRFTAEPSKESAYQLHFHLSPSATLHNDGCVTTHGEGGNLLIVPVSGASGTAELEPNPYPLDGYENPQHLCYTRRTKGNDLFVTLLVPFENDDKPAVTASLAEVECDQRVLSPWEGTGLKIKIDDDEHFYFDQHMHWNLPWRSGEYQGRERLFHSAVM